MVREDLTAVYALENQIFSDPWPLRSFEEIFDEDSWQALIAESEGRLIGYACFLDIAGEAHIANIAVSSEFRRKSVAKRLLDRILLFAQDSRCEMIILEVRPSNRPALEFYKKAGFAELYRKPNYYTSPKEDALVMVLWLNAGTDGD